MSRFWVNNAGKLIIITDDTQDRTSDGLIEVPVTSPSEYHYWDGAVWVLKPQTPEELRELMPTITPRQFRDTLIDNDIMPDQVTAAIGQIPDAKTKAKALNAWEYPTSFERTDPLIDQIGAIFSLTPEQIDAMWQEALEA